MIYTSINNPKIKELSKLKIKKQRDKLGLFLVEGAHLVKEAYESGYLKELLLLENSEFKGEYGDIIERELYNGALTGLSLDGEHYFYANRLEISNK